MEVSHRASERVGRSGVLWHRHALRGVRSSAHPSELLTPTTVWTSMGSSSPRTPLEPPSTRTHPQIRHAAAASGRRHHRAVYPAARLPLSLSLPPERAHERMRTGPRSSPFSIDLRKVINPRSPSDGATVSPRSEPAPCENRLARWPRRAAERHVFAACRVPRAHMMKHFNGRRHAGVRTMGCDMIASCARFFLSRGVTRRRESAHARPRRAHDQFSE